MHSDAVAILNDSVTTHNSRINANKKLMTDSISSHNSRINSVQDNANSRILINDAVDIGGIRLIDDNTGDRRLHVNQGLYVANNATIAGSITTTEIFTAGNYIYLVGNSTTNGSWRMKATLSGSFIIETRISGSWVTKQELTY